MLHDNIFNASSEIEKKEALLTGKITQKTRTNGFFQFLKNVWRTAISPLTQTLMTIGIFPAQALSTSKKIWGLKSIVGFITRKTGNDSRKAKDTFQEDYIEKKTPELRTGLGGTIWNFFNTNKKAGPANTYNLKVYSSQTDYKTDFGRNVKLETFNFEHINFNSLLPQEKYYRIHCGNNTANCSRFFSELSTLSQRHPELKTITYNHPGVEGSNGVTMSQDDLINALCAQVKELLANGALPENIELSGFSIGAATAALTAAKLKNEGLDVKFKSIETNLYDDRTFSTMGNVVTNGFPILRGIFKVFKAIPLLKELTHYVLQPLVKNLVIEPLLWLTNWDMDPARAYKSITPERRQLTVVKPQSIGEGFLKSIGKYIGKFTGFFKRNNADKVIPAYVSLLSGTDNATELKTWKKQIATLEKDVADHDGKISNAEILDELHPTNSVSSEALVRLKLAAVEQTNAKDLVCLLNAGVKARRFFGVAEANAHNNTSETLVSRINPEVMKAALRASGLDENLPPNGVTLYSLHHQAIRNKNIRDREAEAKPIKHEVHR